MQINIQISITNVNLANYLRLQRKCRDLTINKTASIVKLGQLPTYELVNFELPFNKNPSLLSVNFKNNSPVTGSICRKKNYELE